MRNFATYVALAIATQVPQPQPVPTAPLGLVAPAPRTSNEAVPNKVDGLELTPDMAVTAAQRYVTVQATAVGTVNWLVYGSTAKAVGFVEVPGTRSILVFPNDADDVILVHAWTAVGGEPSRMARCVIKVSRGPVTPVTTVPPQVYTEPPQVSPVTPVPIPTMSPVPAKAAPGKTVVLIVDAAKVPIDVANAVTNGTLKKQLSDNGMTLNVVTQGSPAAAPYAQAVAAAGGTPCVAVVDGTGTLVARSRFQNLADVLRAAGIGK